MTNDLLKVSKLHVINTIFPYKKPQISSAVLRDIDLAQKTAMQSQRKKTNDDLKTKIHLIISRSKSINESEALLNHLIDIDLKKTKFQQLKDFAKNHKFIVVTAACLLGTAILDPFLGGILTIAAIAIRSIVYLVEQGIALYKKCFFSSEISRNNEEADLIEQTVESASEDNSSLLSEENVEKEKELLVPLQEEFEQNGDSIESSDSSSEANLLPFAFTYSFENKKYEDEKKKVLLWILAEYTPLVEKWKIYLKERIATLKIDLNEIVWPMGFLEIEKKNTAKEVCSKLTELIETEKKNTDKEVCSKLNNELKAFFEILYREIKAQGLSENSIVCLKKDFKLKDDQINILKKMNVSNEQIIGVAIIGCYLIEDIKNDYSIE